MSLVQTLEDNKSIVIAVGVAIGIIALVTVLILLLIPAPFKGGYVSSMRIEEVREWRAEEEEAQYRTEHYWTTESYTDSNGNRRTRTVQRSRTVYDHTDIVTYDYVDDKDYVLVVNSFDNVAGYNWFERQSKKERPCLDFTLYVTEEVYANMRLERPFDVKKYKRLFWRNDHISKTEVGRRNR